MAGEQLSIFATFKINESDYCLDNAYIIKTALRPELEPLVNQPDYYLGALPGQPVIPVFDLNRLLSVTSTEIAGDIFRAMKEKHLAWVKALEKSVMENTEFLLPRDHHKCSFGQWYDNYKTNNFSIKYVLAKINEPHRQLHEQAVVVDTCRAAGDKDGAVAALNQARYICTELMLPLLDELVSVYDNNRNGHIITVSVNDKKFAVAVDEVGSAIKVKPERIKDAGIDSPYIKNAVMPLDGTVTHIIDMLSLAKLVRVREG